MKKCYRCGNKATHITTSGKYTCSVSSSHCPSVAEKISNSLKKFLPDKVECENCNRTFTEAKLGQHVKFCLTKRFNPCLNCGQKTSNAKFCNSSCSASYNNSNRKKSKVEVKCSGCDKSLFRKSKAVTLSKSGKVLSRHFCDVKCQGLYRTQQRLLRKRKQGSISREELLDSQNGACAICGRKTWNKLPIPLELDHQDGNSENNKRKNLRLICPNCHAQTSTYKGRNLGSGRHYRRQRYLEGKSY